MRVPLSEGQKMLTELKGSGALIGGFKMRVERGFLLIPSVTGKEYGDFEISKKKRMMHVGSFENIADFFVIKKRDDWEKILNEITEKRKPRAVFLDEGVFGEERRRKLTLVYGEGEPIGIVKENGIRMKVDLNRAYFSPRLSSIRYHLLENLIHYKREMVVDMYAGIGPISLLLLKNCVNTISIDINNEAIELLKYNLKINRLRGNPVVADSNKITKCLGPDQVIMNNPTQDADVSREVISGFPKGTIVHFFHLSNKYSSINWEFTKMIERREVHGYSPKNSLFYYLLETI